MEIYQTFMLILVSDKFKCKFFQNYGNPSDIYVDYCINTIYYLKYYV